MLRPRIIVSLMLHNNYLYKSINFKNYSYVGDPLNSVRLFNEKEVDELLLCDVDASQCNKLPNFSLIKEISEECRMPFAYAGGVSSREIASKLVSFGVEKVGINTSAFLNPSLIKQISDEIGSQSVIGIIDYGKRKQFFRRADKGIYYNSSSSFEVHDIFSLAKCYVDNGAGELLFNSVDRDGTYSGYDLETARAMSSQLKIPLTFLGGCGSYEHMKELINECGIIGVAASSIHIYKGPHKAVMINYPSRQQKFSICALNA